MAGEKRDLDYFMQNPHELPGSLGDLEAAVMGMQPEGEGGEQEGTTEQPGEQGAASGTKVEENAAAAAKPNEQQQEQQQEQGEPAQVVKSKDGKHEIPYSVLASEREQRKAAETALQQMQAQVAELTARVNGAGQAPAAQAAATDGVPTDADIDAISTDFPAVGKMLKALVGQVGQLNQQLTAVRDSEGNRREREANTASTTVQEAIDNNPTLSYLQSKDPEGFARAVQFDNVIKADPRNRGLSLDERFSKVVQAMEGAFGKVELPAEFQRAAPTPPAATAPTPAAKPAQPTGQANVAAKPAAAPASRPEVASLSDIPGGVPPESDEVTQLGMLSAQDLGNKFMSMDPNKVLQILAKAA